MVLSQQRLRQILGLLWLADGLLQLQPQMFTANMINGVMAPLPTGQPGFIAITLRWIIAFTTVHLTFMNWLIAIVQIALGLLFLSGRWVKWTVIASIIWAPIVWYGGEGMSMLLTGTGSALTGAPGAVLLYPLLGLVVYPREQRPAGDGMRQFFRRLAARVPGLARMAAPLAPVVRSSVSSRSAGLEASEGGLLSRLELRWVLAGFWIFAALLQIQPNWWQPGQISQSIAAMVGQGGLNSVLFDPVLSRISQATATFEIPLNLLLVAVFLTLGIGLALAQDRYLRLFVVASIVVSALIWYVAEACGMIFTGMATDFNSGLLLIVIALAVLPKPALVHSAQARPVSATGQSQHSVQSV